LFEMHRKGYITVEKLVEKIAHNPAILFEIKDRGYIRKGYKADLVLINPNAPWTVTKDNIVYKCGWSPFEGTTFTARVTHTFVNGHLAYENGRFSESTKAERLTFNR
jgi:dihydroorotase